METAVKSADEQPDGSLCPQVLDQPVESPPVPVDVSFSGGVSDDAPALEPAAASSTHGTSAKPFKEECIDALRAVWRAFCSAVVLRLWLAKAALVWCLVITPMALMVGTMCALFLWVLTMITSTRLENPWLLFLLPLFGTAVSCLYHYFGRSASRGTGLVIAETHAARKMQRGRHVPFRMGPLVLIGTWLAHLGGASVGREGTGVQMAVSISSTYIRLLDRLGIHVRDGDRALFIAGISAGFAGVFGTPVAATLFSVEVLSVGQLDISCLFPSIVAAVVSDWTTSMWFVLMGETHGSYNSVCLRIGCDIKQQPHVSTQWDVLAAVAFLGVLSGLVASVFAWLTHTISKVCARFIRDVRIRPFVGGLLVIGLRYAVGSTDYLGLGAYAPSSHYDGVSISSAFRSGGAQPYSWVLKLLFTCLSLGTGFKGGEVTPLFFIGATLGNAFAWMLGRSSDMVGFYAAIGFVAVFAGATNTPIACAVMGIELFGGNHFLYVAVSCIVAFLSSAEASIYDSQQMSMFAKLSVLPLEVGLFKRQKEKANSSDAGCSEPPNTV